MPFRLSLKESLHIIQMMIVILEINQFSSLGNRKVVTKEMKYLKGMLRVHLGDNIERLRQTFSGENSQLVM